MRVANLVVGEKMSRNNKRKVCVCMRERAIVKCMKLRVEPRWVGLEDRTQDSPAENK